MSCPRCGSPMDPDSDICSVCGAGPDKPVTGAPMRPPRPDARKGRGPSDSKSGTKAIIILSVVMIIAAVAGIWSLGVNDSSDPLEPRTVGNVTLYDGMAYSYISVVDPTNGLVSYTGPGTIVRWECKVLSATYLVKTLYGYYEERGYDETLGEYLSFYEPGNYQVILYVDGEEKASGRIVLDGTVKQSFEWSQTVDGTAYDYTVTWTYSFSDYYKYASDASAVREEALWLEASRFVVVDSAVLGLEDALSKEYLDVRGSSMSLTGHEYADYLLSFVQCAIPYPDMVSWKDGHWYYDPENGNGDMFINGREEYWSYPMETLYLRTGDCEDTSFLACALFSAAGYTSGVAVLDDHVMVAIGLDSVAPNPDPSHYGSDTFVLGTGEVMYFCETTFDAAVPAGYYSPAVQSEIEELESLSMVYPYKAVAA